MGNDSRWTPAEDRQWDPMLSNEELAVLLLLREGPCEIAFGTRLYGPTMNLLDRRLAVESQVVPHMFYVTPAGIEASLKKERRSGKAWNPWGIFPAGHRIWKMLGAALGKAMAPLPRDSWIGW